jgi:hypothetical protein
MAFPGIFEFHFKCAVMYQIPPELLEYYKGIKPRAGYIYYFLDDNLKDVQRDQLKIGVGFYRSPWIDGAFLFEADSYILKSLKEYLAVQYLKKGNYNVWAEWTAYYARLWAGVGISRLMGVGSFYLTGHGPTMIIRKNLSELLIPVEMQPVEGESQETEKEGYLVCRDPGGGAHLRNWKIFYVVLSDILDKAGILRLDDELINTMAGDDPDSRFVMKADEEIYGFPSLFRVTKVDLAHLKDKPELETAPSLDEWIQNEAQFDAGGFTEEFKTYYKFVMDNYTREDNLPDILSIIEHGIGWFLSVLPEKTMPSYRQRYYDLVERYASSDIDKKMLLTWLDNVMSAIGKAQ